MEDEASYFSVAGVLVAIRDWESWKALRVEDGPSQKDSVEADIDDIRLQLPDLK